MINLVKIYIMKKYLKNERVCLDTQSVYLQNGEFSVYPCSYEHVDDITIEGKDVVIRGTTRLSANGKAVFRPYTKTGVERHYDYQTKYTRMRFCKHDVVMEMKVPKNLGKGDLLRIMDREFAEVNDFLNKTVLFN